MIIDQYKRQQIILFNIYNFAIAICVKTHAIIFHTIEVFYTFFPLPLHSMNTTVPISNWCLINPNLQYLKSMLTQKVQPSYYSGDLNSQDIY